MLAIALSVSVLLLLCAAVAWRRRRGSAAGTRSSSPVGHDACEHLPACGNAGPGGALAAFYAYQLGSARARAWQ